MNSISSPKHLKNIEMTLVNKIRDIRKPSSVLFEYQQRYFDEILVVHQEAFQSLISNTKTYSRILERIKVSYDKALQIRDKRLVQLLTQDRVFGVSIAKNERDDKIKNLLRMNENLKDENLKLNFEILKLKRDMGKVKDEQFSEYLNLMRERDARYTLYFENLGLHLKIKELDGSAYCVDPTYGDPMVLRIALDKCREQLSTTQFKLMKKNEKYSDTVPRRKYDKLETMHSEITKTLEAVKNELKKLQDVHIRTLAQKKSVEEELSEIKERCSELERAGTPRPHWDICGDFIGGGRNRWWQLTNGMTSRDILRVLLKELGPAAETENLEHFDGLGTDPMIPPYLRYEGKVRNLRLSRRDVSLIINDIWNGKANCRDMPMQDYVSKYFEDRYQQASMRAEWAYNLCASAEQMLEDPQVKLFWGVTHGHLSEDIYWGLRMHFENLKTNLYKHAKDRETISCEDFQKVAKATFPLKTEVDIKNLIDVVRKQLSMKLNNNEINLDKLFHQNEEGFDRCELSRELYRQRQAAQDRYLRQLMAAVTPPRRALARSNTHVTLQALKRAFAIVDPAIDHIRMERYIRWVFSDQSDLSEDSALPLKVVAARLAAGDIERVGPSIGHTRRFFKKHNT